MAEDVGGIRPNDEITVGNEEELRMIEDWREDVSLKLTDFLRHLLEKKSINLFFRQVPGDDHLIVRLPPIDIGITGNANGEFDILDSLRVDGRLTVGAVKLGVPAKIQDLCDKMLTKLRAGEQALGGLALVGATTD